MSGIELEEITKNHGVWNGKCSLHPALARCQSKEMDMQCCGIYGVDGVVDRSAPHDALYDYMERIPRHLPPDDS